MPKQLTAANAAPISAAAREKARARSRNYYLQNRDRILKTRREKCSADPECAEKRKDYNREYYAKNKAKILARRREKRAGLKKGTLPVISL